MDQNKTTCLLSVVLLNLKKVARLPSMFDMAAWYCTFEYESIKYGERSVWFDQVKGVGTSTLLTPLVAFFAYQDCAVFVPTPPLA